MTNGVLLAGRLLLAAAVLPSALAHASNISGLALQLWMKGMPFSTAVATGIVVAEVFAPVALILGLAPRLAASVLIAALVVATGTLHRFWEVSGPSRDGEQAIACGQIGFVAGLLFYAISGPGAWTLRALWSRAAETSKPAKTSTRAKTSKTRSASTRAQAAAA